nr:pesticidal protein Cry7Aa [Bacteroidaceae bacterium]
MIILKREGIIIEPTNLPFENDGVMNPAVIAEGNEVHLFYRAVRKGNHSTIGYCRMEGPLNVVYRSESPVLSPELDSESQGMEDPRIVKIDGIYYMAYTAYDGDNAVGALATSTDLKHFERKGVITSQLTYQEFVELLKEDHYPHTEKYFRTYNNRALAMPEGKPLYLTDKDIV